ncbi:hypothetical protein COY27_00030 [Candidatus Woesearchaeota archaeon CG_4_10_14_0_2_um_filter_33_13]|nr:MAG: hypothetical protein COY27_00030 [Candidatus Woesearchaeota archaeon CG_4_10_14_0_2_um_filter_33_13]
MEEIKALKAIEQVVNTSEDVRINFANLKRMAKGLINKKKKHWTEECPIDLSEFDEREKIAFMFVFNSISFSYWGHPK